MFGPGGDTIDPPVPRFYTESHRALQSSASKPVYPTPRTRRSTPPRNSPKTTNHSVADTSLCPIPRIRLFEKIHTLPIGVYFTHTIRSPMPRENMKCRNEAHIFHQSSQALLRRLPMAHTNWFRYMRVRGVDWHPCWTHVQQMSHGPSPASSPLHSASAELRRTRFQYAPSPKPILRDIWLYDCSLASTAQDSVLNCQCGLLLTTGRAMRTSQGPHEVPRAG